MAELAAARDLSKKGLGEASGAVIAHVIVNNISLFAKLLCDGNQLGIGCRQAVLQALANGSKENELGVVLVGQRLLM